MSAIRVTWRDRVTAVMIGDSVRALVDSGAEIGLQVAVHHRGEPVVDAVAGVADRSSGRPVTHDTLFFSFSTGKGIASAIAHLLVRHTAVEYETPVVELWPEFGAGGKASTTLGHVLTQTAGVPLMPPGTTPAGLTDWSRVCAGIAATEPRWAPGTATGYHSYTFGYLVGEIARRATGHPIGRLLHDWVAVPLGIAGELYFGVPEHELGRLARLEDAEPGEVTNWEHRPSAALGNDRDFLRADVPSVGTGTARGIATVYAAMLDGRLVDADQLGRLSSVAFEGTDQVLGNPVRMALGYPLGRIGAAPTEPPTALGWPGGGGSYAYADPTTGIAFALTKNRLTPDFSTAQRIAGLVNAELAPPPDR